MRAGLRRLFFPAIWGAALALCAAAGLSASQSPAKAEGDLVLGTWALNVAKSKWVPGPAPRSQTRTYETHQDGVKATIRTVYADGRSTSVEYVAKYDSIEYPLSGSPDAERIALKRLDSHTAEATLGHAGKVMGTNREMVVAVAVARAAASNRSM